MRPALAVSPTAARLRPLRAAAARRARTRATAWLPPLLYAVLACALVVPAAARGLPGAGPDAGLSVWWLQWVPHALGHGLNPLHSDAILAPSGVNAMWNTSILLPSLLLAPITLLAGPVVAYAVLVTAAPALSAWAAYAALRRLVPHRGAAFAGGLLYGFSPYVVAHSLGHPNLSLAVFPPLALLVLDRILRGTTPRRDGALLGLAAVAQLLSGEELLLTTSLAAALCLGILALQHREGVRAHGKRLAQGIGAAAAVALVLGAAPLAYQFLGPDRVQGPVQQAVFGSDLDSFVVPSSLQWLALPRAVDHAAGFSRITQGVPTEVNAYLGIPLLLLLLVAARRLRRRDPLVRFAAPAALLLAVLSMGGHLHRDGLVTALPLPWALFEHLPLFDNVVPPRLMVHAWLLIAALVAVVLAGAAAMPRGRTRALALGGVALSLLALVPRPLPSTTAATPAFFTGAARTLPAGTTLLVAPWSDPFDTRAMVWQAESGIAFRMPGGFAFGGGSAQAPATLLERALGSVDRGATLVPLSSDLRARLVAELHALEVDAVVATTPAESALVAGLLGRSPQRVEGVDVWWGVA